jgi:hypothetical protein
MPKRFFKECDHIICNCTVYASDIVSSNKTLICEDFVVITLVFLGGRINRLLRTGFY